MDKCSCLSFGTFNIVKISFLPNLINRFSTIPFKIPINYFVDVNKQLLQLMWKTTRSRIANWVLKKEKKLKDSHCTISGVNVKLQKSR